MRGLFGKCLGAALAAAAVVCGVAHAADDAWQRIRTEGTIRIGYAVEAPYAFEDGGTVTGESPELARLVAARLGIPHIEWVRTGFGDLLPGLDAGRFDVAAAGMFITDERRRHAIFSPPTVRVVPGFLVQKGNPLGVRSYFDLLVNTAARVIVVSGSVEEAELERRGVSPSRIQRRASAEDAMRRVAAGAADVLALSLPTVRRMADEAGLEAVALAPDAGGALPTFQVGIAFSKDQPRLAGEWSKAQQKVLGSPAHLAAIARFGFTYADIVH